MRRVRVKQDAVSKVAAEAALDVVFDHMARHKGKLQAAMVKEMRQRGVDPALVTQSEAIDASMKIDQVAGKLFADEFLNALSR